MRTVLKNQSKPISQLLLFLLGLLFNKAADSCDYARNVHCKTKKDTPAAVTTTTTTTTTTPKPTTKPQRISRVTLRTTARTTTTTSAPEYEVFYKLFFHKKTAHSPILPLR